MRTDIAALLVLGLLSLCGMGGAFAGDYEAGAVVLKRGKPPQKTVQQGKLKPNNHPDGAVALQPATAGEARLRLSQVFLAGKKGPAKAASKPAEFRSDEPIVFVRFHHQQAAADDQLRAIWNHLGSKDKATVGLFASAALTLDQGDGKGQFSFRPVNGSWYPGSYRVDLYDAGGLLESIPFTVVPFAGQGLGSRSSLRVLDAALTTGIKDRRPKKRVKEFSDMWKRLMLWTRIDGGSRGGELTASWYGGKHGKLQARHTQQIDAGESWVVFWLHLEHSEKLLPVGSARVELRQSGHAVRTVGYRVKKTGFLKRIGDAFKQVGEEFQSLMEQESR
jgi:hypothetical protein